MGPPPDDDVERWDKGPPQDFNNYANFVGVLAERYKGRIQHFQVWNEPNLTGEWGGKPISPEQYGLLLRLTRTQLRAHHPDALLVTAGLAQTIEDGRATNNLSELDFLQRLYDAGYGDSFDILAVMAYGLGHSPEDRRVGPKETNFSRLQLAREVMVRNGDAAKPIWAAEYGWVALPADWQGPRRTSWGEGVDEQTQAQWTIAGLDRARREWPWLGAVFVWGFRWVEAPAAQHADPARYFEVVRHDFTPRLVYWALRSWASRQDVAMAGPLSLGDRVLTWQGSWRDEERGGRLYRVTETPDSTMELVFQGTDIQALLDTDPDQGTLYVAIDGHPAAGLPTDDIGSYIRLNGRNTAAAEFDLAVRLPPGDHHVALRSGGTGQVAVGAITVGSRRPFAWVLPLFITGDLIVLFATLFLSARVLVRASVSTAPSPEQGDLSAPSRRVSSPDDLSS